MRVLVMGPGRSGTSWVGAVLGTTAGAGYVYEPDDVRWVPFAVRATPRLGTLPVLAPDDDGPPALTRLWDAAFGAPVRYLPGRHRVAAALFKGATDAERRAVVHPTRGHTTIRLRVAGALAVPRHDPAPARHHVVKSFRTPFMVDWICARWDPAVVVCRRHPLDVVASALELGQHMDVDELSPKALAVARDRWGVAPPDAHDPVRLMAWRVGMVMSACDDVLRVHPEFRAVDHEELCADPVGEFERVARDAGLEWTEESAQFVRDSNRPGSGYELLRIAEDLPGRWRKRLSPADARAATDVLAQYPIGGR
jgi:hypothetical protein